MRMESFFSFAAIVVPPKKENSICDVEKCVSHHFIEFNINRNAREKSFFCCFVCQKLFAVKVNK